MNDEDRILEDIKEILKELDEQERILHFYFFISSVSIINRTLPLCPS